MSNIIIGAQQLTGHRASLLLLLYYRRRGRQRKRRDADRGENLTVEISTDQTKRFANLVFNIAHWLMIRASDLAHTALIDCSLQQMIEQCSIFMLSATNSHAILAQAQGGVGLHKICTAVS